MPVEENGNRGADTFLHNRVDEEALPVPAGDEMITGIGKAGYPGLKQGFGWSGFKAGAGADFHGHQFAVGRDVEELAAIASPESLGSSV